MKRQLYLFLDGHFVFKKKKKSNPSNQMFQVLALKMYNAIVRLLTLI